MLTQEKEDIKERLSNLPKDELNEFISSLGSDLDLSQGESKKFKIGRMTWDKFDKLLILIAGGVSLGSACSGLRGAAIGGVLAVVYGCYILNDEVNHPQSPDKPC
jgi:hypothetical protein